ncbi:hypothetical protein [Cryptosporangium arvum]|uniref:hypothetical protein n=1 Tax=Cryptosporangium arvum TaxID=80871 RepID=UPI0004B38157|nr:hypothetical protein [Cryptosporangium arvum]
MDGAGWLIGLVVFAVVSAGVTAVGTQRRQRRVVGGETVRCRTTLVVGEERPPWWRGLRAGWLHFSPGRAEWRSAFGRTHADLSGARVHAVSGTAGTYGAVGDTDLRLTLANGGRVRLDLKRRDAVTLTGALSARAPRGNPAPPARRRWPVIALALCGAWLLTWALDGPTVDRDWTVVLALAGTPLGIAGLAGLAFDHGDRRTPHRTLPVPARPLEPELPPLIEPRFDDLAPYAAREARPYVWLDPRRPDGIRLRPGRPEVLDRLGAPAAVMILVVSVLRPTSVTSVAAMLTLGAALLLGVWALQRVVTLFPAHRTLRALADQPGEAVSGLVTADPDGAPVLLLSGRDRCRVPLRCPLPAAALDFTGPLRLRSHDRLFTFDDVPGVALLPDGPITALSADELTTFFDSAGALRRDGRRAAAGYRV